MLFAGGGFWALTRGSYSGPQASRDVPAVPAAAAAAAVPEPAPPATAVPGEPAELPEQANPSAAQAVAAAPRVAKPAQRPTRTQRSARKPSPGEREPTTSAQAPSEPEPAAQANVIKVTPRSTEGLPETPSRDDVLAALDPVRPKVAQCAPGQHGVAEVDITVSDTGAVTHAVVAGDFAGTPEGSCIARAVRGATFRPFQKPRFRVIYPFSL
jgi:hypothetical protein